MLFGYFFTLVFIGGDLNLDCTMMLSVPPFIVTEPDYSGRTALRQPKFDPRRKDGVAKELRFPLKPIPEELPYEVYSSLMGLLASAGASLQLGPN
jgi:hypothetical protein